MFIDCARTEICGKKKKVQGRQYYFSRSIIYAAWASQPRDNNSPQYRSVSQRHCGCLVAGTLEPYMLVIIIMLQLGKLEQGGSEGPLKLPLDRAFTGNVHRMKLCTELYMSRLIQVRT